MTGRSQQRRRGKTVGEWYPLRQKRKKSGLSNTANIPKTIRIGTCPGPKQRSTDDNCDRAVVLRRLERVQRSIRLGMKIVRTDNCVVGFKY